MSNCTLKSRPSILMPLINILVNVKVLEEIMENEENGNIVKVQSNGIIGEKVSWKAWNI